MWVLTLALVTAACGGSSVDKEVAVAVALTQTAAAVQPPAATPTSPPAAAPTSPAVETGAISGVVHLQAPPTPPMIVYAVDISTGEWASVETVQTDGEAPFTLKVKPGSYQVFAWMVDGPAYAGHSLDGRELTPVLVQAGQGVAGIRVTPQGNGPCVGFGLPASPDGRFPAVKATWQPCDENGNPLNTSTLQPDYAACTALGSLLQTRFGITFASSDAPFQDYVNNKSGQGCQVSGVMGGVHAKDMDVVRMAEQVMGDSGWSQDMQYMASGPHGSVIGYTKGDSLCLLETSWGPTEASLCSSDEAFAACWERLTLEQKRYTVKLDCAQPPAPGD